MVLEPEGQMTKNNCIIKVNMLEFLLLDKEIPYKEEHDHGI